MTAVARKPDQISEISRPAREEALPADDVELNSDESFPASDPPSWTPVARVGIPRTPPEIPRDPALVR
jgi:hypothetical protein